MKRNFSALDNNIFNSNYQNRRHENKSFYIENPTENIDNFLGRSFIQRQNVKKKNGHVTLFQRRAERKEEIDRKTPEHKKNDERYLKRINDLEKEIKKLKSSNNNNSFYNDSNNNLITSHNYSNYDDIKKENFLLRKIISEQKDKIRKLEMIINSNNINNFKEKEEMYLQKIYELESYNKHLNSLISYSINSNSNKNEDILYNYLNSNNDEYDKYENEIPQKNKIYKKNESQKNTKKNYRIKTNKSLENLINEREMLIKNANYTDNDPIIIHLNNKIDKYKKYM